MSDLGDRVLGSTVTFQFTTAVNGIPTALAGSPAISVYGSNSSTPITAGVSFTGSYNSTTGLNNVAVVASTANGFAAGIDYSVVITTGTLSGISMIGYQVGTFSIALATTVSNKKKNTASNGFEFLMTDSTTHQPKTGLTITSQVSIDGGAFAATANSATEISNGVYTINFAAADTNGNHLMFLFTATGADPLYFEEITQP